MFNDVLLRSVIYQTSLRQDIPIRATGVSIPGKREFKDKGGAQSGQRSEGPQGEWVEAGLAPNFVEARENADAISSTEFPCKQRRSSISL